MKRPLEGINPNVALLWETRADEIPEDLLPEISDISLRNPVENLGLPFLYFVDSSIFSPAAQAWEKSKKNAGRHGKPAYTKHPPGTTAYKQFWEEEERRCIHGYEPIVDGKPCGVKITGEHYFYLNYCRIQLKIKDPVSGRTQKKEEFPAFLSMDYYWFHTLDRAENPEKYGKDLSEKSHLIMAKARRKGWSFKNAAGAAYIYFLVEDGRVVIASQYGDKGKETFSMALVMIDFVNKYTEFRQPHTSRRNTKNDCYIHSGTIDLETDSYVGIGTSIQTISLKDKPDAAAGLSATRFLVEEAGQVEQLKATLEFSLPTLADGEDLIGIMIVYGTGGDMDKGAKEFSEVFYDPETSDMKGFDNIYEQGGTQGKCGYFVDELWFRPSRFNHKGISYQGVDSQGNPHRWVAELSLNTERKSKAKGSQETYGTFLTQRCKTPSEAFMVINSNVFDVASLQEIYSRKRFNGEFNFVSTAGRLTEVGGKIRFLPDLEGKLRPLSFPHKTSGEGNRLDGCILQYEAPRTIEGVIPDGAYIVVMDTIDIDNEGGQSLCAIYVVKTMRYANQIGGDEIVMEYVGRPKYDTIDTCNRYAMYMCKYYNAKLSHENDRGGKTVVDFFIKHREYGLLMNPPERVVKGHIPNSRTLLRKKGHSMGSDEMKTLGEIYFKRWLEKVRTTTEDGRKIRNQDVLPSRGLYEELMYYNRKGNFDRVMAMLGGALQLQENFNEFIAEETDEETAADWFAEKIKQYNDKSS